jgi:tRNA (mo5U34)-methyltransferase
MTAAATDAALAAEVAAMQWYHTLELAPGIVTPGWFDTRPVAPQLPMPASLARRRCLDVATFDGFWAFEMERRGAAEVVAIDLLDPAEFDWPPNSPPAAMAAIGERKGTGRGFEIARDRLGSAVRRHALNVYDLTPAALGTFDYVYLGSLLVHLRDPVRALSRIRSVCTGELLLVDGIDPLLTRLFPRRPVATLDVRGRPWWWTCNVAGLVRMLHAAGFSAAEPRRIGMPAGRGQPLAPLSLATITARAAWRDALRRRYGDPHAAIRAIPV